MAWIVENWYLVLVVFSCGVVGGVAIKKWSEKPTAEQIANIKEWLLYAVTEAETTLGSGTGQLKLRMVYDMAIEKFGWLAFVSFEAFSGWVDEALEEMKKMLANNDTINQIVKGDCDV